MRCRSNSVHDRLGISSSRLDLAEARFLSMMAKRQGNAFSGLSFYHALADLRSVLLETLKSYRLNPSCSAFLPHAILTRHGCKMLPQLLPLLRRGVRSGLVQIKPLLI